jgi:sugar diacid utilization regulator
MPSRSTKTSVHLNELIRRFDRSVPQVARAITKEIYAEIPGYAALDDSTVRADVEEAAARNVSSFLRALGEGRDLTNRDIDALGKVGSRRAHQGIPLEDVLRAFRTVGRVLWDHLSRELRTTSAPPMDVAIELAGTLMRFTDQISSAVARQYSIAQRSIVRQQEAARREFLHDLLLGTYRTPDVMVDRARVFGYDLARSHVAIVAAREDGKADPAGDELAMNRALDQLAERFSGLGQPMVDRRGGQTIGLIAMAPGSEMKTAEIAPELLKHLGDGWRLGMGGPYPGLEGCRRAYLEAREAAEIGPITDPDQHVWLFENLLLYRFLRADHELVERFVDAILGPIIEHDRRRRSELVKTLEAYFATDGSAKEAGRRLYAHPHTITYRLKQIERLTGRLVRDPEDKLHLHLAVKALRLIQGTAPAEDTLALPSAASQ